MENSSINICAVDLFCGIGGLTYGLQKAGINVKAGVDNDSSCRGAYLRNNHKADFISEDIREITRDRIDRYYHNADIKVLAGCAPCQPFSSHANKKKTHNNENENENFSLLLELSRLVVECQPDILSVENVPGLMKTDIYYSFLKTLEKEGFKFSDRIVFCPEYGIPQTRKRLVLLASKLGDINLVPPPHKDKESYPTVAQAIKGVCSNKDPYHVTMNLTKRNIERIKQSKPGGDWRDWDKELVSPCHQKNNLLRSIRKNEVGLARPNNNNPILLLQHWQIWTPERKQNYFSSGSRFIADFSEIISSAPKR